MRKRAGTEVAEADIHLKLDRLLAGQDQVLARLEEQGATTAVLIAGMVTMTETIATQTETINRLSEAMSREADRGHVRSLIELIAASLK
jgi:phosphoserine phosphatase